MTEHPDYFDGPAFAPDLFAPRGRLARLCKGGGAPARNRELEREQLRLIRAQQRAAERSIALPEIEIPPPPPPPPPPPTQTASDAEDAATEARRRALARRGVFSTLLAGETGGYSSSALGGRQTLLG